MRIPGFGKKKNSGKIQKLDAGVKKLLGMMDELLARLPNEEIDRFSKSKDFKLYESVMKKYRIREQKI